ncbi:SGF29 tudor-like domain-containing protein [Crepidotus variabilis]|uniref:SGF29 tudor-like domain-containing protein n=1 Tax=Crepidotus variabilis TaxID=179855 RepID=A0A9P6EQZ1_9AGAR|nr:SGF29 tudor-like domain-containing protein [Crepidotus variabilis]
MDRRRGLSGRPSEEIECWAHAAESLSILSNIYANPSATDTLGRVNRLINCWPSDDTPPAQGIASLKTVQQKLTSGLSDIMTACDTEIKAIDDVLERVGVLIALRKAPEVLLSGGEKRNKRPRGSSPGTPIPVAAGNPRSVSITVPPRTNSVGPTGRDSRNKKDSSKNVPLQQGRKVAFKPPFSGSGLVHETDWIMAIVVKYLGVDKNGYKYTVQDAEPQDDGQPGATYTAYGKSILPLPDVHAAPGTPAHIGQYREFPVGSMVMAMYPDTSCFYRAEVVAFDRSITKPIYKVKFDDDDDQVHDVQVYLVVEYPDHLR